MATLGQIVLYVTRVSPTRKDPRGMGLPTVPDNPANYDQIPAIVSKLLSGTRVAVLVFSDPPFARIGIDLFNAGTPHWDTYKALP